jgi:hypothetical protein
LNVGYTIPLDTSEIVVTIKDTIIVIAVLLAMEEYDLKNKNIGASANSVIK